MFEKKWWDDIKSHVIAVKLTALLSIRAAFASAWLETSEASHAWMTNACVAMLLFSALLVLGHKCPDLRKVLEGPLMGLGIWKLYLTYQWFMLEHREPTWAFVCALLLI